MDANACYHACFNCWCYGYCLHTEVAAENISPVRPSGGLRADLLKYTRMTFLESVRVRSVARPADIEFPLLFLWAHSPHTFL